MSEVKDISEKITLNVFKDYVEVTLQANQYHLEKLEQFQLFLEEKKGLLAGSIKEASEEQLTLRYEKDAYSVPLNQVIKKMDAFSRLLLAQKLHFLTEFLHSPSQPFLHPQNLFLFGEEIRVAHRGFMQDIVPYTADETAFFKQYRALVLYLLHPKLDYEKLIEGSSTLQDPLSKRIHEASSISDIEQLLGEQVMKQKAKREKESRTVHKKHYMLFKWGSVAFGILTILFAIVAAIYAFDKVPAKERIISAEAQYIANDYAGVLETLKTDNPENLPTGAQYASAVSSVQLDNLSNEQKEAILNNLSQKSSENTLYYWIYIGKGEFNKALDIAQNIGDNQYILHAYTKLYDATKVDNKMKGAKKQELLTTYEEAIKKYMELLGGETSEAQSE